MIDLAQHIEILLLENDCVIVPGLGGFVAHRMPAQFVADEMLFIPPTRVIGFNPMLKMNDGLLVQSYMAVYGTNFVHATRIVEREVAELYEVLQAEGSCRLGNIGELHYNMQQTCDFIPFDNKLTSPAFFGLDSIQMKPLVRQKAQEASRQSSNAVRLWTKKELADRFSSEVMPHVRRASIVVANAAAVVAVILLFVFSSTPIKNTEVVNANYAQLLPTELFQQQMREKSVAMTTVKMNDGKTSKGKAVDRVKISTKNTETATKKAAEATKNAETPVKTAPTSAPATPKSVAKKYHIIVASVGTEKDANAMAKRLVSEGHNSAKAIIADGKNRVCISSFATESEAYQAVTKIRENAAYQAAWVLKH